MPNAMSRHRIDSLSLIRLHALCLCSLFCVRIDAAVSESSTAVSVAATQRSLGRTLFAAIAVAAALLHAACLAPLASLLAFHAMIFAQGTTTLEWIRRRRAAREAADSRARARARAAARNRDVRAPGEVEIAASPMRVPA